MPAPSKSCNAETLNVDAAPAGVWNVRGFDAGRYRDGRRRPAFKDQPEQPGGDGGKGGLANWPGRRREVGDGAEGDAVVAGFQPCQGNWRYSESALWLSKAHRGYRCELIEFGHDPPGCLVTGVFDRDDFEGGQKRPSASDSRARSRVRDPLAVVRAGDGPRLTGSHLGDAPDEFLHTGCRTHPGSAGSAPNGRCCNRQLEAKPFRRGSSTFYGRLPCRGAECCPVLRVRGIPLETVNAWTPPAPESASHSRSFRMPVVSTLPSIQCHHTRGLADMGGSTELSNRLAPVGERGWAWRHRSRGPP